MFSHHWYVLWVSKLICHDLQCQDISQYLGLLPIRILIPRVLFLPVSACICLHVFGISFLPYAWQSTRQILPRSFYQFHLLLLLLLVNMLKIIPSTFCFRGHTFPLVKHILDFGLFQPCLQRFAIYWHLPLFPLVLRNTMASADSYVWAFYRTCLLYAA